MQGMTDWLHNVPMLGKNWAYSTQSLRPCPS